LTSTEARSYPLLGANSIFASPKNRELDLDVVRGVAVLLAMGWHMNSYVGNPVFDALMAPGRAVGWAGVDLFFVLSGFLVGRMVFREEVRTGAFDFPTFFRRRVFKLWPMLYLLIAVMMLGDRDWSEYVWQCSLHLTNYFPPQHALQLWSLAVEEHFYLALGLLVPAYLRRRTAWSLWPWLTGLMVLSFVLRLIGWRLGASAQDLQWQTQYRIDALACGVLLALISVQRPQLLDRMLKFRPLMAVIVVLGCVILTVNSKASAFGETIGFSVSYLTAAAFMLLIYRSGVDRVASWPCRVIGFIGVYSYALYLWQMIALHYAPMLSAKIHGGQVGQVVIAYALDMVIAFIVTRMVERPAIWFRDRMFPAHATAV